MKILYISQYYPPEMGAPSARVSELSRQWASQGHDVTVLTAFPHHPHGTKLPEDRRVLTRRERDQGVDIVRTYVYAAPNAGFLKRIVSYLSFMFSAIFIGTWRVGRPDVVIATSPQFFCAFAGRWISFVKRVPFIFEVRDLWPESIVTVGAMNDSLAIRVLKRMAAWLYKSCDQIVTVGDGYRRRIISSYGINPAKIKVVTNGVDIDRFQFDQIARDKLRREHRWEDECVALYLGTHGMAHGLDSVLETARLLKDRSPVRFVFVGDGAEKKKLQQLAEEKNLTNVTFLPPADKEGVVRYYSAADLCLVPLKKVDLFTDVLPSKIFEIMGMGKPILLSVDGDARRVVERAEAGLFIEPENSASLAETIETLRTDPQRCATYGEKGKSFVREKYDRNKLAQDYLQILADLANSTKATTQVLVPKSAGESA